MTPEAVLIYSALASVLMALIVLAVGAWIGLVLLVFKMIDAVERRVIERRLRQHRERKY